MYRDSEKEYRDYIKRQSRITTGADWAVGLLLGTIFGIAGFAITLFSPLFAKDLTIVFLGSELDLRPLAAPFMGGLAGFAGLLLGICSSIKKREKKAEEEAASRRAENMEELRKKSRF